MKPELFLIAFVPYFLALWTFLFWVFSHLSGWRTLARRYAFRERFDGTRLRFCSAKLRWVDYGNCLTLGGNARGLYLCPQFPFRLFHPPLFIPWDDIQATRVVWLIFNMYRLTITAEPSVTIWLREKTLRKLLVRMNEVQELSVHPRDNEHWGGLLRHPKVP